MTDDSEILLVQVQKLLLLKDARNNFGKLIGLLGKWMINLMRRFLWLRRSGFASPRR